MNKAELIKAISTQTELTQKDVEKFVNTLQEVIGEQLSQGEKVALSGFGTFEVTERAAREGIVNFGDKKGETWTTEASKAVKFKVSKNLKDIINQ